MRPSKRLAHQHAQALRINKVYDLLKRRKTPAQIAKKLHTSQHTISSSIDILRGGTASGKLAFIPEPGQRVLPFQKQRALRINKVYDLLKRRKSREQIRSALGVSMGSVQADINILRESTIAGKLDFTPRWHQRPLNTKKKKGCQKLIKFASKLIAHKLVGGVEIYNRVLPNRKISLLIYKNRRRFGQVFFEKIVGDKKKRLSVASLEKISVNSNLGIKEKAVLFGLAAGISGEIIGEHFGETRANVNLIKQRLERTARLPSKNKAEGKKCRKLS